jgi:hypothetical protein
MKVQGKSRWVVSIALACGLGAGCAHMGQKNSAPDEAENGVGPDHHVAVAMPREATATRDDRSAPILQVATVDDVVFPYVYGYPIYPEGDAARGLISFRRDNAKGARDTDKEDSDGVVHAIEELPALGCKFEGIRENVNKYVPVSLTCELPAPKALGGTKRPVLGGISVGAKAEQVLKDPSVQENFLGAFHLTSDDFAGGSGTGYFNTTHGQLALVFSKKRLTRFIYYFDPDVKAWQNPALWVKP